MKKLVAAALAALLTMSLAAPCTAWAAGEDNEEGEEFVPVYKLEQEQKKAAGFTPDSELPVKSAVLMEQGSGRILFERDADTQLAPASVTKIMSLLLVMEALDRGQIALQDSVTCSDTAAAYGGSQIWLEPGEQMTVDELLKAAAIASANDATVCLAEYVAGSELAFVELMNKRAQELGMKNTTFKCAAGLDNEGHLTTARDIAIMSRELMRHPTIKNYTTVWMDSLRGGTTELVNTNRMVRFYNGATGLKTGTTSGAGSCLSATAERDGLGLIAVVMGAPTSDDRFAAARALLDWGYATYQSISLSAPDPLGPLPVHGGTQPEVAVQPVLPQGVVVQKNKAELLQQQVTLPERLDAPIEQGQEIGSVTVTAEGETLLTYPLTAACAVPEMTLGRALGLLWQSFLKAA